MAFSTSNTLDRAYASDNKGLYVYGSYKGADYEGPNSLASQAGGTDISPENVTPFDAFTQADLPEIETIRSHYAGRTGIGMDVDGTRGSLWGLYNSITQFHTHDAGRQKDAGARARARLEALYGGVASERNARALEACLALV